MAKNKKRLYSFIEGADESFFPLENLPFGIFKPNKDTTPRAGTAIGDYVLDLSELERAGLFELNIDHTVFDKESLNDFASLGQLSWDAVRHRLQALLAKDSKELDKQNIVKQALIKQNDVMMLLPFKTEAFSDFYASEHHASNVGKLFRSKENPLLPNWKYLPVGYHGRASTIFASGTPIRRPKGQIKPPNEDHPRFGPSQKLDFELELGAFVGVGNPCGTPISLREANTHIFGLTLLNDWSARDIQAFEYQPLGPFLAKSFATSISPWVVTNSALSDFRKPCPPQIPKVADYLYDETLRQPSIKLKVELQPRGTKQRTVICETNSSELYWTLEQMLAHHTVNNCIMKTGDLIGSGTISGEDKQSWGSLLELTLNGAQPIQLAEGVERQFLEDGDTVIFTGYCEGDGYKIGFGELKGTII